MRFCASLIGVLLLSGIVSAQQAFHTGFPTEPVRGYFQPVEIRTPEGTSLACVAAGQFSERFSSPLQIGLLIGCDYRLRITDIPYNPGKELFPTITLIARTYPPQGREQEFPIIVNLTEEDLELALAGRYVVRVVYLENPTAALPIPTGNGDQLSHDIQGGDPVAAAAMQGLPVAIVRIGGRIPSQNVPLSPEFCCGSPPWMLNRTVLLENVPPHEKAQTPINSLTIDPALKTTAAGDGVGTMEKRQTMQANAWQPPHRPTAPGGRADEYIASGSDTDRPVYVEGWTVHNFSPGSTIAHFDTLDGRVHVEPSNRLHIYAPRFGAIRKVEGLLNEGQITALMESRDQQILRQNKNILQTGFAEHESGTRSARKQDQLKSIEAQRRGAGIGSAQGPGGFDNFIEVDQDSMMLMQRVFDFDRYAETKSLQRDKNSEVRAAAWAGNEGIRVQINEFAPIAATGIDGVAVYFQVEDERSQTSKLRLIKVADKESALPGEIIQFTLRFDNIGDKTDPSKLIGNVTILDDLSSRLDFVPGSATASLASGFKTQLNASGGITLRFEITDPLAPSDFGVIQYQCIVR
jgi:uncharacterized repeat protein (TIGR01451 family)